VARKNIIKFESDFEGVLFGIVTQLKDYRLCWHINKELGYDLKKLNDVEIVHKKKNKTAVFTLSRYENDMDKWLVHLVSNRHQGEYLIPEMKQTDFFLMINGEVDEIKKNEIHSALKKISAIQFIVTIDYEALKSKENLVFE
jgi:hypothetical protein